MQEYLQSLAVHPRHVVVGSRFLCPDCGAEGYVNFNLGQILHGGEVVVWQLAGKQVYRCVKNSASQAEVTALEAQRKKEQYERHRTRARFLSVAATAIEGLADLRTTAQAPWPSVLEDFEKAAHAVLDAYLSVANAEIAGVPDARPKEQDAL